MTRAKQTRLQKILSNIKPMRGGFQGRGMVDGEPLYSFDYDKQVVADSITKQYNNIIDGKVTPQSLTLDRLSSLYFKGKKCEPKTLKNQKSLYENSIKPYFKNGTIRTKDITRIMCTDWTNELIKKGLSENSVFISCVGVLSSMFNFAIRNDLAQINPLFKMSKQKALDTRQPVPEEELKKWLECAKVRSEKFHNDTYYLCALLILDTGARINEAMALRWQDIDLVNKSVSITKQFDEIAGNTEKDVKNHIRRLNPIINPELIELLTKIKKETGAKENDFIFQSPEVSHYPLQAKGIEAGFSRISKACGIKATPHLLRHNTGERLVEWTGNAYNAQHVLGHARLSTTMGYLAKKDYSNNMRLREVLTDNTKLSIAFTKGQNNVAVS